MSLAPTPAIAPVIGTPEELEASLKASLHSLSLILAYYASVSAASATAYATNPPRQHTLKLREQAGNFERSCDAIEGKLVRAIAVLERDARKAQGLPPLNPVPPPAVLELASAATAAAAAAASATAIDPSSPKPPPIDALVASHVEQNPDLSALHSTALGLSMPPAVAPIVLPPLSSSTTTADPTQSTSTTMDIDPVSSSAYLNHSLFGDSAAPSLMPSAAASPTNPQASGAGGALGGDTPDLDSIMALLADYPPANDGSTATSALGLGNLDFSSSSSAVPSSMPSTAFATGAMPTSTAPLGTTSEPPFDLSLLSSFGSLPAAADSSTTGGGQGDFSNLAGLGGLDFTGLAGVGGTGDGGGGSGGGGGGGMDLSMMDFSATDMDLEEWMKTVT